MPLASGGMGTVYVGAVRGAGGFEREVAVKLIHDHLREEEQFTADLLEEAKLAVRIRHPNVVGVLDAGEEADGVYLVMDYVEGDSLAGLMRRMRKMDRAIPAQVGLRILRDALLGLHAAHELVVDGKPVELVHRDFTPQNILVGVDGIAKLTDFGVAKAASRNSHTATGLVKGKLHYMPPEQAKAEPIDRRADIWSGGVIAWELLARRRLFSDLNDAAIVLQLVSSLPPPLRSVRDTIPVALERVVQKALSPLDDRYLTAQDFAQELEAAAEGLGGLASTEEVATFTKAATREKLEKRQEQIEQVRVLRNSLDSLTEPEKETPNTPSDFGPARTWSAEEVVIHDDPSTGATQSPVSITPAALQARPPSRSMLLGAAALALVIGGGVAAWLSGNRPDAEPPVAADVTPPVDAPPAPVAAPQPEVVSPAPSATAPETKRRSLRSPSVIAKVLIGDDALDVSPGREVTVEVATDVKTLTVVSANGQRKTVSLGEGDEVTEVRFAAASPLPAAPRPVSPPTPPPPGDGLAPNPFD